MLHDQHYVSPIAPNAAARLRFPEIVGRSVKMSGDWDGAINGNQTARERANMMMAENWYRIVREYPDLVQYVEPGKSEERALIDLIARCNQFKNTRKPVTDGKYFVRKLGNWHDDAECFTVKDGIVERRDPARLTNRVICR